LEDYLALYLGSKDFRCPEDISASESPGSKRMSVFLGFSYLFSGMVKNRAGGL
jgi:hypothetical protein